VSWTYPSTGLASVCRRPTATSKPHTWTTVKAVGSQSFGDSKSARVESAPVSPAAAKSFVPAVAAFSSASPTGAPISRASEADGLIRAVYAHMFGQAYLFAADRACLTPAESAFRAGIMTVKDLVRAVAKSPAYTARFLEKQTTFANVEVLTGHLLGRRPTGVDDYRRWARVYDAAGYDAMVNAMMDDGEYDEAFGDATVPHGRLHGLSVTGPEAYRRAVTPTGIRLDGAEGGEEDGAGMAAGLAVVGLLAALAIGLALSTGGSL